MRSDCVDLAVIKNYDSVCLRYRGNSLRNDNFCGFRKTLRQPFPELCFRNRIDRAGRIVQNEDPGLFQERSCNAEALLLPSGKVHAALSQLRLIAVF